MSRHKTFALLALIVMALAAVAGCVPPPALVASQAASQPAATNQEAAAAPTETFAPGHGHGRGMGMMAMHHAEAPAEYTSLTNPVAADAESLTRGEAIYTANCATCHGDDGMGAGPAAEALDPEPAPLAHTSQMMSDTYLFWRISEGGAEFATAMPAWKIALTQEERWDVVNYVNALGSGEAARLGLGRGRGRGPGPNADERAQQAEMLAAAVAQGVFTQEEADLFQRVHAALDEHYGAATGAMQGMGQRGMMTMQRALGGQAVRDGVIMQEDADRFTELHDRLMAAGLMH